MPAVSRYSRVNANQGWPLPRTQLQSAVFLPVLQGRRKYQNSGENRGAHPYSPVARPNAVAVSQVCRSGNGCPQVVISPWQGSSCRLILTVSSVSARHLISSPDRPMISSPRTFLSYTPLLRFVPLPSPFHRPPANYTGKAVVNSGFKATSGSPFRRA